TKQDHFCFAYIQPQSATYSQTLLFLFISMLMILSYIFHFQAPILFQILILCLPLLIPFILGFLLTDFLLILPKLNIYFLAIPSNGLNLFLLLFSFVEIFLHLLINVETLASFLTVILPLKNALARVVVPSVRRNHHITPTLRQLHRLPIQKRITFKIAFITFKTLHHKQPSYLADLLTTRHDTSHNTRSSYSPNFLSVPKIYSERGRRSFLYAAPTIWNSLPDSLRASVSVSSFLSGLKTHLFPP